MQQLSERVAALVASFEAEKNYQHERWHKLDNDLTPMVSLPERLTREIGRLQGLVEGKITSMSKELERSMEAAIKSAIEPLSVKVSTLETEVEKLKLDGSKLTGARLLAAWIVSTVITIIAAVGWGHK